MSKKCSNVNWQDVSSCLSSPVISSHNTAATELSFGCSPTPPSPHFVVSCRVFRKEQLAHTFHRVTGITAYLWQRRHWLLILQHGTELFSLQNPFIHYLISASVTKHIGNLLATVFFVLLLISTPGTGLCSCRSISTRRLLLRNGSQDSVWL